LFRSREAELELEVKQVQARLSEVLERGATPLPLSKSSSFILGGKNVPLDPQV
jgi:hypothetical protein